MDTYTALLSLIIFLPVLGALALGCLPFLFPRENPDAARYFTLGITALVLALTLFGLIDPMGNSPAHFDAAQAEMQTVFSLPWIPSFNIYYTMGLDGISLPLVVLTAFVSMLAMAASWSITKNVKAYCILFLLLETGMLGVFMALDFFLFYVFWEVMLLPMYFLIGVWGGPRREYAAIKFFLYTLVGSVLMLVALLMLYFSSDLRELARFDADDANSSLVWQDLRIHPDVEASLGRTTVRGEGGGSELVFYQAANEQSQPLRIAVHIGDGGNSVSYDAARHSAVLQLANDASAADVAAVINGHETLGELLLAGSRGEGPAPLVNGHALLLPAADGRPVHTFNMLAMAAIGQRTKLFSAPLLFGWSLQVWAFLLLFLGFAVKVPSVPLHTWLPDAHVEAPTPISMILAGVLLKMGGYGIIRICYPICPEGGYQWMYWVCGIGALSMVYGAFAALAQKDFKRLVAYSSVSHMGYVVLGLGVWSATSANGFNSDYWNMGVQGAMFQMIGHGISSAGMFFMVGVLYDRVHHRDLDKFGGIFGKMPVYTALAIGIFFAGLGLPGLCGFIGEVLVVLSVWAFSKTLAIISAGVVVLTAAYILWTLQRVYLGAEYRGPHEENLVDVNAREGLIGGVLLFFAILFGVAPYWIGNQPSVLKYMDATISKQVDQLAEWTQREHSQDGALLEDVPEIESVAEASQLGGVEATFVAAPLSAVNAAEQIGDGRIADERVAIDEHPAVSASE